jgi:Cdc6-like AAA superfamily ATPase
MVAVEINWDVKDWEVQDLFSPAAPIASASLIAGRRPQIDRLMEAVFERGRHAVLYGERGVGKTSVASTFHMRFASGSMKSIMSIRKAAFPTDTFSSLWRRVFAEMENDGIRVSERYPGEITPDDVVRELNGFSLNTLPIIILDEFDKFTDLAGKRLMSHTIKSISDDRASTATVVLVGVAEDINLLVEEHGSISRNITEIKMPRMSQAEMEEVIDQRYPQAGMTLSADARNSITSLARGLPEYVHFLARDAARSALRERRLVVNNDDVRHAIEKMMETSDQTSEESYETAVASNKQHNLYKHVLLGCALADADDLGRFRPSDVLPELTKILGREIKIANFFPHMEAFCTPERGSVLEKKGTTQAFKYRFREPKMQPYVMMKSVNLNLISAEKILSQ